MELEDSILDFSDEEESFEDGDVKMNDIEEGELVERISKTGLEESGDACASSTNPVSGNKNQRRKKNKRKNKRKRGSSGPKVTDINRFVTLTILIIPFKGGKRSFALLITICILCLFPYRKHY
uniref:Uncharacterized protein n=1 Tax=Nicotiana tabacum TaxID=4097 RepID=A0A1S4BEC7_TOBAC|nr:PREDICTED: uncharacterized protein LOC107807350 [Nicotiana tabacum]